MNFKTPAISLIAFLTCATASAQFHYHNYANDYARAEKYGYAKLYHRQEWGYIQPFSTLNFKEHFTQNNPNVFENNTYILNPNGPNIDTTIKRKIKSTGSLGAMVGMYCPVGKLDDNSCLAISIEFMYLLQTYNVGTINYSGRESGMSETETAVSFMFGMPIGLDYKYGGDAVLNKHKRFMFTFGAGVIPSMVETKYILDNLSYKTVPYIKAEAGFFCGIAMKVRATILPGKMVSLQSSTPNRFSQNPDTDNTDLTMSAQPTYTLGFIIMPYSFGWSKDYD